MKRILFRSFMGFMLLLLMQTITTFAQPSDNIDGAVRRMAAILRIRSGLIKIQDPVLYLGFHNQDSTLKRLEKSLENDFLLRFTGIVVSPVHQDSALSHKFDLLNFHKIKIDLTRRSMLLKDPDQFRYLLYGILEKEDETGRITVRAVLYRLSDDTLFESGKLPLN